VITEAAPSKPIRLEVDEHGFGTVTVGDDNISNTVSEVTIVARVGKPNLVTCQENGPGVRVEMGMPVLAIIAEGHDVKLRDEERSALIALGWTPPASNESGVTGE